MRTFIQVMNHHKNVVLGELRIGLTSLASAVIQTRLSMQSAQATS